jgi:ATP-binding protein involved in chromosome partitioning
MVQNMSYFSCPCCSTKTHIFGAHGVAKVAERMGIPLLGQIPLDADICTLSDQGRPIVVAKPSSEQAQIYMDMAKALTQLIQ